MPSIDKTRAPGEDSTRILLRSLVGALGGVSATGPMTIGMIWLHRLLPPKHRYSLPPREITMNLLEGLGIDKKLGPDARAALTLINHPRSVEPCNQTPTLTQRIDVPRAPRLGSVRGCVC
jgi:hypothetical protein